MGAVYLVEQLSTGKERALKCMHPNLVQDPALREKFANEARVASRIESDHIVEVVGAGVDEMTGAPWLAMEYLRGQTLTDLVEKSGPRGVDESVEILKQLGHGLGAAHRAGFVHRDIKPENVFLAETRREGQRFMVKVLDFGIAKVVQDARAATATQAMGSPFWMAPEQTEARGHIGPGTDVWAVGLLGFFLLTGRSFWIAGNQEGAPLQALLREMLFEPIPTASERAKALGAGPLPAWFDTWFGGCLQRQLQARYADASACVQSLVSLSQAAAAAQRVPTAPTPEGVAPTVAMAVVDPSLLATGASLGPVPSAPTMVAAMSPAMSPAMQPVPGAGVVGAAGVPVLATGQTPRPRSKAPMVVGGLVLLAAVGASAAFLTHKPTHIDDTPPRSAETLPTAVAVDAQVVPSPALEPAPAPTEPIPVVVDAGPAPAVEAPVAPRPSQPSRTPTRRPSQPAQTVPPAQPAQPATPAPTAPTTPAQPTPEPAQPTQPSTPEPAQPAQPGFDQVVQQWGRNPDVMRRRAEALEQVGQRDRAARAWEQYLQANPEAADRDAVQQRITALRSGGGDAPNGGGRGPGGRRPR